MRVLLAALLLASGACSSLSPKRAEGHLKRGQQLHRTGQLDRAVVVYRQASESFPDDVQAHYFEASALAAQGKKNDAQASYQKADSLDRKFITARRIRKGKPLPGESQLWSWNVAPLEPAPAPAAAVRPPSPPAEDAAVEAPLAPPPPKAKPERSSGLGLESIRLSEVDVSNSEAFFTLAMQMRADGKETEAAFMLKQFLSLERSSPQPRKDLMKKAEEALFMLDAEE